MCFCSAAAIGCSGLPLELMELPLGRFSPQMGTAGGDPPPRAGVTLPSTSSCCLLPPLLLPPSPAVPLLGLSLQSAAQVLTPNRRGGECGSSRGGWTTVMSQACICPRRRADALPWLFLHSRSPHRGKETDMLK